MYTMMVYIRNWNMLILVDILHLLKQPWVCLDVQVCLSEMRLWLCVSSCTWCIALCVDVVVLEVVAKAMILTLHPYAVIQPGMVQAGGNQPILKGQTCGAFLWLLIVMWMMAVVVIGKRKGFFLDDEVTVHDYVCDVCIVNDTEIVAMVSYY